MCFSGNARAASKFRPRACLPSTNSDLSGGLGRPIDETEGLAQFVDEAREGFLPLRLSAHPENGGWVDRREAAARIAPTEKAAAVPHQDNRSAHQCGSGRDAERDDKSGVDGGDFPIEPPTARLDLCPVRGFVKSSLSSRLVFEMFDDICEVDGPAFDMSLRQGAAKHLSSGPTNGRPTKSSLSPGCSPTIMMIASTGPCPKTVCVALE